MDISTLVILSGGLFLGWALGANDAANVFGTAVGTKMVRFSTAALVCSLFVVLGSVISGAGPAETLSKLSEIDQSVHAFIAVVSAGFTVFVMTRFGLPVSTSQAIVGALIGWNVFQGIETDSDILRKIIASWILCPVLAGLIAAAMLPPLAAVMRILNLRLFVQDVTVRWALLAAGAFGAYSLGANNIANVMGPFIHVIRPPSISLGSFFLNPTQVLFLIGALAIAVGVVTFGRRVMFTVGRNLFQLSPLTAWVAVVSHAIVLILFTSKSLATWLDAAGLPQIPLVPVSSSQAIVGAVIGIGLFRGASSIRWHLVGGIVLGWLITPICAGMLCLAALISVQMML